MRSTTILTRLSEQDDVIN